MTKVDNQAGVSPENENEPSDIQNEVNRWERTTLRTHLENQPEIQESFLTGGDRTPLKALYSPADLDSTDQGYLTKIGFPGEMPFTRGRLPAGFRTFPWKLGYYAGYGSPTEANRRYRQLVDAGAGYVTLAMDLPSQCGYGPSHPYSAYEVGRVGVSILSIDDMSDLFSGIPLKTVGTGTVGNCIAPLMVGLFSGVAETQGLSPGDVHVTLQNDPLKEFTGRGTQIIPIRESVDLAADVVEFCIRYRKKWIPQYACTTQLRWGGVSASEEIAFGIANLFAYVDTVVERGFKAEEVVPRLEGLHMTTDNDFMEEIAKFRATRRLWSRLASERYGTESSEVCGLKITTYTGAHRMTAQQPLNNITRTAMHVLASLFGGVERISTPGYDEALALPTEESQSISNLAKMIALYEAGATNTADPLGGSYLLEYLTDTLEEQALEIYREVESAGGAVEAIEAGVYEIAMIRGTKEYFDGVESGDRYVVGVNQSVTEHETEIELFRSNPEFQEVQIEREERSKKSRNATVTSAALAQLETVLQEKKSGKRVNAVPAFIEAINAKGTVGEIGEIMRGVYGG